MLDPSNTLHSVVVIDGLDYSEGTLIIHLAMGFRHQYKTEKMGIIGSERVGKTAVVTQVRRSMYIEASWLAHDMTSFV